MAACTFFGHKNTPLNTKSLLEKTVVDLIENKDVTIFYVGNQGNFDGLAISVLKKLSNLYPQIRYSIVLAYLPPKKSDYLHENFQNTIFPDFLTTTPPKFAIHKRNSWMLRNSDFVITYIKNPFGNSAQFYEKAKRSNKTVINLAEL